MDGQTNPNAASPVPSGGFTKFVSNLSKIVDPIGVYGGAVSCVALAFMMFMTVVDILGRYIGGFNVIHDAMGFIRPVPGSFEMTELLLGVLISFGLGYCAVYKGHIRVDLILQYTSRKTNLWFDIFTYGISFIFFCGVTWQAWINGANLSANQLKTSVLGIPIFPFPFVLTLGAAILALVLLRDFLKSIEGVRN